MANDSSMNPISPAGAAHLAGDEGARARKLREATEAFEGMFVKLLLESMRKTTPDGFYGQSQSAQIHGSLVEHELSRELAHGGMLGIAEALYRELAPAAGISERRPESAVASYRRANGRELAPIQIETRKDGDTE